MLKVGLGNEDVQILRRLSSATVPSLSSSSRNQEQPFKLSIIEKIQAAETPSNISDTVFTIDQLEHDHRILRIFINIVKKSKPDRPYKQKAEALDEKIASFLNLKKQLDRSVKKALYLLLRDIVRGRLSNWKFSRRESSKEIVETLRLRLQKPDESETYLGDLAIIMGCLKRLECDPQSFPLYPIYKCKAEEFNLAENEMSIALLFNDYRDRLYKKLEEVFEESKNKEKSRLNNVYGPSLKQMSELALPKISGDSKSFISTQAEEKPVVVYGGDQCVAYTVRAPNLKPPYCNGDGFLFAEFQNGITLSAVVDASGNSPLSRRAANILLETLYKEAKLCLQRGCTNRQLLSHLLTHGHIAALAHETPCTLAFNFCFPKLSGKIEYTCLGGAFGDSGAFLFNTQPKLALTEYNATPANKLRSSSLGTLGDVFKRKLTKSEASPLKFDFWQLQVPASAFIILCTDGFRMHLEPENLLKTPVEVCKEMNFSWFEGDEEKNWEAHQGLRRSYSRHLILENYKAISESIKVDKEEAAATEKLAKELLEVHKAYLSDSISSLKLSERVLAVHKANLSFQTFALKLVENLLEGFSGNSEFSEEQFPEKLLETGNSIQKIADELIDVCAAREAEGVSVQKLAEALIDYCFNSSNEIIDMVLKEKEDPPMNVPGVIDDITILVQKLPSLERLDSPWF